MGRPTRTAVHLSIALTMALGLFSATRSDAAPTITVGLNQGLRIPISGTVANVVVTNPNIADVTVVDAHDVIVIGKGYGMSEVMVTDSNGHLLLDDVVNVALPWDDVLTVYRGNAPQRYFCTPRCEALPAAPAQGGAASPST
jgi:Flp pilus assembly secretin CpaC